ncbi:glycosyltransferase [Terrabacter aerolatus]|uniref:Glycosyl transferase n=1 Tax=Terrabacter aerolatus TaxID=422442 RepID=A0A512CZ23_9MICO|nr:glycosyltransferase [Terrabacter aerolatus]GEO29459.1 glycosyl transferase [Terrabacter aerolatus]
MRILLLGMGSRGDVQPLVALGQRLRRIGYAVSLAAPADLGHVVAGAGLDFQPLSFDLERPLREGLGRDSLRGSARTQVREARLMRQVMAGTAEALAADVARLVDAADAVVSGALTFDLVDALLAPGGSSGRGRPSKPHLYAVFAPVWPSAHGPSVALALRPRATSWANGAWSTLAGRVALDLFRPAGDLVRARGGLPRRRFRHYTAAAEGTPTLLAASTSVVPPAADWPPALRQTGYWFRDDAPTPMDSRVEAFLAAGEPPVFVGFGSMPTPDPAGVSRDVADVLGRLGVRGVVSEGLAGLRAAPSPGLLGVGPAPHEALFPRCAVVVHHGGAGTTAAAVRAGVPQVVVPHAADQPYWGRRLADLGVAPQPIARKDVTADRLAQALEVALSPGARRAAYALGERVRAEDGAGDAARLVDAHLRRSA